MVGELHGELVGSSQQPPSMCEIQLELQRTGRSRMKVDWHIELHNHLPEWVILRLVVVQKSVWSLSALISFALHFTMVLTVVVASRLEVIQHCAVESELVHRPSELLPCLRSIMH